jgi:O-antigen ligase
MYILFSIAILISLWKEFPFIHKNLLKVLLIALFTIVIVLLSARAGIIAYIAVFIIYFGVYLKTRFPIYQRVFFILIILGAITFFALNNIRFQTIVKNQENETLYTRIKSDMRWQIWSSGIEVIRDNPVFGVGTGDVTKELLKKYEERSLEEAYRRNMNVHNQFLETYLGLGIIGFLSLISMFVVPFIGRYQAFSKLLCILFMIIVIANFFVETMLNTIAGVVFFAYFYPLVFYRFSDAKTDNYNWKVIFRDRSI